MSATMAANAAAPHAPSLTVRSNVSPGDIDSWVRSRTAATGYHLTGWQDVIERAFGHETTCLAATHGDTIVGQMEMQVLEEPRRGYVNLFYLIEEMRGVGVSGELQDYAMDFMRRNGVQSAQLSVSPTNTRALAFYRKHGWRDLGLRPGRDNVNLMECDVLRIPG